MLETLLIKKVFMGARLSLLCIWGFILLVSKSSLTLAKDIQISEQLSIQEVQEYAANAVRNVDQVVEFILSIPSEQYAYENILMPWNQLLKQLSQNFHVLNAIAAANVLSSWRAYQAVEELNEYIIEILNYPFFYQALLSCSQKILHGQKSDPFQCYVAMSFIANNWKKPVYLYDFLEKKPFLEDLTAEVFPLGHLTYNLSLNIQEEFMILPVKSRNDTGGGGKCETGIKGRWGDGKGIQWEGYIKAEVYDNKGNRAEAQITQKDDGTGEVDIRGSHEVNN